MHIINDDAARMSARNALETVGCAVVGVDSQRNGLQVRIKRGAFCAVLAHAAREGCTVADSHFFPIGSEQVGAEFRHDGSFPGSAGFVCNALVIFPL